MYRQLLITYCSIGGLCVNHYKMKKYNRIKLIRFVLANWLSEAQSTALMPFEIRLLSSKVFFFLWDKLNESERRFSKWNIQLAIEILSVFFGAAFINCAIFADNLKYFVSKIWPGISISNFQNLTGDQNSGGVYTICNPCRLPGESRKLIHRFS